LTIKVLREASPRQGRDLAAALGGLFLQANFLVRSEFIEYKVILLGT
jgi:hypothetical protein